MAKRISDELREFADAEVLSAIQISDLKHMAKRIDAEMVELPQSADGKIWTGREVCFWTGAEQAGYHNFGCVGLRDGRWYVEDVYGMYYEAESVWYERPDSFERIADELDEMVDAADSADDSCEKLADLAERIRRLAKEDDK